MNPPPNKKMLVFWDILATFSTKIRNPCRASYLVFNSLTPWHHYYFLTATMETRPREQRGIRDIQKERRRENRRKRNAFLSSQKFNLSKKIFKFPRKRKLPWKCWPNWPMLTVETDVNGDSKRKNERGPFLVGSLGLPCRYYRFLFCLGCCSRPSIFFPRRTLFPFHCPHRPASWNRPPCWVTCLLCVSGVDPTPLFKAIK